MKKYVLIFVLFGLNNLVVVAQDQSASTGPHDTIYDTNEIDKMPGFPGGEAGLQKFILEDINIPALNKDELICSISAISFVVQKNGELTDFSVLKDCGWANSLILALQSGPCWMPGKINDVPVAVKFVLPLRLCFR